MCETSTCTSPRAPGRFWKSEVLAAKWGPCHIHHLRTAHVELGTLTLRRLALHDSRFPLQHGGLPLIIASCFRYPGEAMCALSAGIFLRLVPLSGQRMSVFSLSSSAWRATAIVPAVGTPSRTVGSGLLPAALQYASGRRASDSARWPRITAQTEGMFGPAYTGLLQKLGLRAAQAPIGGQATFALLC